MRILFVTARFPEARNRGDQSRAAGQIRYLARRHAVTVISGQPASSGAAHGELARLADVHAASPGLPTRAASALELVARGGPGQVGWMMTRSCWRRACLLAERSDVVIATTVRAVRGPVPAPLLIDHVDSLSANMAIRAKGPENLPRRLAARVEARLMIGWERRVSSWSEAALATSALDAARLPGHPPVVVSPVAWDGELTSSTATQRDIDVIFTGNMRYPPNAAAARMVALEILPVLRARRAGTTALIVGRGADKLDLANVEVASDVPDVMPYLRRAKVALAPLVGTGSPYKVLEAAAGGAAVVGSEFALRAFEMEAVVATRADEYVSAVLALLEDEARRRDVVRASQTAVHAHTADVVGERLESLLRSIAR